MSRPKYPNRITVCMTDDLLKNIQNELGLQHMLGSLSKTDCNVLLLNICKAIEENTSNPIFLQSIGDVEGKKNEL